MKYIYVSLIILCFSLFLGILLNERFSWIDIDGIVDFDIEDMMLNALSKINYFWKMFIGNGREEANDITEDYSRYDNGHYIYEEVSDEMVKGLINDYVSLKNEIIIYKDHNEYLRYEKELIDLIEVLNKTEIKYQKEKRFYKYAEQIEDINENEIKDVKNIIKLYSNKY